MLTGTIRPMPDERDEVAEELRQIRHSVREQALLERSPADVLGPARPVQTTAAARAETLPPAGPPPVRPDAAALNTSWDVRTAAPPRGLRGRLAGLVRRLLGPALDAQATFNARQVQLDNELLAYIDGRLEATHRHYDAVLGAYGRHLQDIDKRHLILQEEVVAHVHDLVRRIDLVLAESERSRLSLETALRELRARLNEALPTAARREAGPRA
jgi:hypothetical protein